MRTRVWILSTHIKKPDIAAWPVTPAWGNQRQDNKEDLLANQQALGSVRDPISESN